MKPLTVDWILNNKEKYISWSKKYNMPCKDCGIRVDPYSRMVMLKDELWEEVCDKKSDMICDTCIEKRMGRAIRIKDFKPHRTNQFKLIPCNAFWVKINKKDWLEKNIK